MGTGNRVYEPRNLIKSGKSGLSHINNRQPNSWLSKELRKPAVDADEWTCSPAENPAEILSADL